VAETVEQRHRGRFGVWHGRRGLLNRRQEDTLSWGHSKNGSRSRPGSPTTRADSREHGSRRSTSAARAALGLAGKSMARGPIQRRPEPIAGISLSRILRRGR
jgi:hypothetical protein